MQAVFPVFKHGLRHAGVSVIRVIFNQLLQFEDVMAADRDSSSKVSELHNLLNSPSDPRRRRYRRSCRRKIATSLTKNHDAATGHVFTAVVANAFDNRTGTGVAHGESLCRYAPDIRFTTGCAIQNDIARNNAFFRFKGAFYRWIQDDLAAG